LDIVTEEKISIIETEKIGKSLENYDLSVITYQNQITTIYPPPSPLMLSSNARDINTLF